MINLVCPVQEAFDDAKTGFYVPGYKRIDEHTGVYLPFRPLA
jgi:hypothetical protein